ALVDTEGHVPLCDVTADFVYARLRRSQADEPTGYPAAALDQWTARFRTWAKGDVPKDVNPIDAAAKVAKQSRNVFVYFIAGAKERGPAAAMAMIERVKRP